MLKLRIPRLTAAAMMRRAALAYLIVWVLSPPLAAGSIWRVFAVMAMLLWLALDTLSPRSVVLRPNWPVLGTMVFGMYTAFIEFLVPDAATINLQFPIWIMLFFLFVGESQRRANGNDSQFCFWVVMLILPIWSFATLRGLSTISGDVARTMSRASEETEKLAAQGIGGYGYIYTVVLCVPFLAQLALRNRNEWWIGRRKWTRRLGRTLIWINFLLASLLVLRAGYTIALILSAFSILSVVMIRSRRTLPFAISVVFVCSLVVLAGIALKPALRGMEGMVVGTEYASKVRDLRALLEEDQSTGSVEGRAERYGRSIRVFVENPVIGSLSFDDVGKHSAIMDRFAQYGIGFGLLFMALLVHLPIRVMRSSGAPVGLALGFLIVAIGFPMLNTVFMSWGLILYVFSRGAMTLMGVSMDRSGRMREEEQRERHAQTGPAPRKPPR